MRLKNFLFYMSRYILPALIIIGLYSIDPQLVEPYVMLVKIIAGF